MSLSKENFDKIIKTGLYSYGKDIRRYEHCKNNTYKPHIRDDRIYMLDSYWSNNWESRVEVTNSNIDNWVLLLDFDTYERAHGERCREYNEDDYICVADDSGGWSYPKHYLKKSAKPNKEYQLLLLRSRKASLERNLNETNEIIDKLLEEEK